MPATGSVLPQRLEGPGGLLLRQWEPEDAEALARATAESLEHLRPWMEWVSTEEPASPEARRERILGWKREWLRGENVLLGIFLAGRIVGGCGLHRRLAPGGLEIGYWIHPGYTRRGLATMAAWRLTDAALALPEVTHVEIHHDRANLTSAGVPRRLGFRFLGEHRDTPTAPAELGIEWRWRMDAGRWEQCKREVYLECVLVGGRERVQIELVDYDRGWPERFAAERRQIDHALGEAALRIEHIGSTAVPGLAAKPVIDVLVTVEDPDDDGRLAPALQVAGYGLRVREPGHRMYRTPARDVHVHLWREGDPEVVRHLRFRDRLRESPGDRAAYQALKRRLAGRDWADMNAYAEAKGELIESILGRPAAQPSGQG